MKCAAKLLTAAFFLILRFPVAEAATFQPETIADISPFAPFSARFADFNGDGKQDLALLISNGSLHYVRILTGNGNGTFNNPISPIVDLVVPAAGGSLLVADLNTDGIPDIAVSSPDNNTVSVFIGNGDATFAGLTPIAVGAKPFAMALGDFRGDGTRNDIAAVVDNGGAYSMAILLNDGTGAMTVTDSAGWPTSPDLVADIAVGDFNGDDIDDIAAVRKAANRVRVYPGNGVGTFAAGIDLVVGSQPSAIVAADFNNDGLADLAVVNSADATVTIVKGAGGGAVVDATYAVTNPANGSANPVAITAVDFNRDGIIDIAIANSASNSLSVMAAIGNALFAAPESFNVSYSPSAIAGGDPDGNGNALVAINSSSNNYSLLLNASPAAAGLAVLPGAYDFGNMQPGHLAYLGKLLTLANGGSATLNISAATVSGANSSDFQGVIQDGATCGTTTPSIAPGGRCTVLAKFLNPITAGAKTADLTFASNAVYVPSVTVPLSGSSSTALYAVSISFLGRGSGTVAFSSGDPSCSADCVRYPAVGPAGRSYTLSVQEPLPAGSYFYGWSGCDSYFSGTCRINFGIDSVSDHNITANFGLLPRRVMLQSSPAAYSASISAAYAISGGNEVIKSVTGPFDENLYLGQNIAVTVSGGYDSGFTSQGAATTLKSLTVAAGSLTVDNIILY